jgi:hypothetical protein
MAHAVELLDGLGGTRDYGELAMLQNDDGSSNQLPLPFSVNFFGSTYADFWINNNGNITFNGPVPTFTPEPFPIADQPMIAPYWGDVDTRGGDTDGEDSNNVWVASPNPETVVVTWDMVGYYDSHTSPVNDFQLVLRDRSADTGNPGDFDVEFRYNELNWTTGDASGGTDGLGGVEAQVGYDAGNGEDFLVLPGSRTEAVLELADTSNVSEDFPGLWSFAIRAGEPPGSTPDNPLLPVVTEEGWEFEFNVELDQTVFIDPVVAIGYDYVVNSGPNFQTALLPNVGDGLFEILLWDGSDWVLESIVAAGDIFDFGTGGVDRFRVLGIETSAGLDPDDTLAFVTGLTFARSGIVNMTMTPITQVIDVPEPGTIALIGLGLLGLRFNRNSPRH